MNAAGVEWQEFERSGLVDEVGAALRAGRSVMVTGEAGIGKTTLLRQSAPDESAWIQGLHGLASVALAPFSLIPVDPPLDSVAAAYGWLRRLAEDGTTLMVDDAQWVDPVSAGLIAQAITGGNIRIVMSVRDGHNLSEDLIRATTSFERLSVDALDASMVELALELTLGAEPAPELVHTFTQRSGGNPLYLRELVLGDLRSEALRPDSRGVWSYHRNSSVSSGIAQLVETRLGKLSADARRAVELVALAGHLPARVLEEIVGIEGVSEALDRDLLREDAAELYPGHPTIAEAVTVGMSRFARWSHLSTLVEAIRPVEPTRALRWQIEIGATPSSADLDAGYRSAVANLDLEYAGRLAELSYRQSPTVRAGLRHAHGLQRENRHDEARRLLRELIPLAESSTDLGEVAMVASHTVRTQGPEGLLLGVDDPDRGQAEEVAAWADELLGEDAFSALLSAGDAIVGGALDEALGTLSPHLASSRESLRFDANELALYATFLAGRPEEALEHVSMLRSIGDAYYAERPMVLDPLHLAIICYHNLGRDRDGVALADAAYLELSPSASPTRMFSTLLTRALAFDYVGRVSDGLDALRAAQAHATAAPRSYIGAMLMVRSHLLARSGRTGEAREALELGLREPLAPGMADNGRIWVMLGEALAGRRDAVAGLEEMAAVTGASGHRVLEGFAISSLFRVGQVSDSHVERMRAINDETGAWREWTDFGIARSRGTADLMMDVARRFETRGLIGEAAEAAARAFEMRSEAGDRAEAARIAAYHRTLISQCAGLRWPAVTIPADAPDLTDRELQISELAALAWSNRQIADELSISVRTVENNLQRAYTKLGINRRTEIAAVLGLEAD